MRRLLVLAAFISGCGGSRIILVDGIEIYERVWDRTKQELGRRAAAELNCGTVDFQLIRREGREPVEVLVIGCGRRGMYIKPAASVGGYRAVGSWHLTTVTGEAIEPGAPVRPPVRREPPPPPPPQPTSI